MLYLSAFCRDTSFSKRSVSCASRATSRRIFSAVALCNHTHAFRHMHGKNTAVQYSRQTKDL